MKRQTSHRNRLARLLRPLLLGLALALALPAPGALADSLREVAERVARQYDAKKVVSARVVERGGRKFYVIRILTQDDVIKTIRVPARDRKQLADHVGGVSGLARVPFLVMPGSDRASSVASVGPGPTLHLTGLPVEPAMTQVPPASANRT